MENQESVDWLAKWKMYAPNSVALKDGDSGVELSYSQLFDLSLAMAQVLSTDFSIQPGDRVAVLSQNELEYIALFFAVQKLGAILVPINYRLTVSEVEHIVADCSPKLLLCQAEFADLAQSLNASVRPQYIQLFKGAESFCERSCEQLKQITLVEISNSTHVDSKFLGTPDSPCMIIYTSGTTGAPKGAVLTNKMLFWNSLNTTLRLNLSQQDCAVIFLPLFHTGGWNVLTTPFLHRGAKIVLVKKFDAGQVLQLTQNENATLLFGVPTTMDMLAHHTDFEQIDLQQVRYAIVGGEPMPLPLIEKWHAKGIAIRQGYGLTEFGPNVFSLNEQDAIRKIGSIGFPNFYIDAKVVDEKGNELDPESVGELWLRGPSCMKEYWQNEKATTTTIRDGWLATGDLVRKDSDGFYFVVGRKKDMYKSGGENVYPAELEKVIGQIPGVREVAVIGVPDEKWGEVGKAFVVRSSEQLTSAEVQQHCQKHLAKFKIPKYFEFIQSLPKGDSGKILKRALH